MKNILVTPLGKIDAEILKNISSALEETLHFTVQLGTETPVPENSYDAEREQYHSTKILKKLKKLRPADCARVLAVADVDLFVPGLNYVFGEADVYSGAAVISLTRLRQEFFALSPNTNLFHERAVKEAIHEIGHTYDLGHCSDPKCIMFFSNSLKDTDIKGPGFCSKCKSRLGI